MFCFADKGKENKFKWWLKNKLGERPIIFNEENMLQSQLLFNRYLKSKGYFDASVKPIVRRKKRRVKGIYKIKKGI